MSNNAPIEDRKIRWQVQSIGRNMRGLTFNEDEGDYLRDMIRLSEHGASPAFERKTVTFDPPSSTTITGISVVAGPAVEGYEINVGDVVIVDESGVWAGSVGRVLYLTDDQAVLDLMDGSPAPSWRAFERTQVIPT